MILTADISGERLDAFLARCAEGLTRSAAQKLIEQGLVKRNGKPGKKNDKLEPGDRVEYEVPEAKPVDIVPTRMDLRIVYEDDDLLVIDKPKGLVVHPAPGHQEDTLVNGLLYAMGDDLSGINGELRPGIVHRIDKDTSGLLAVAKNDLAHTMLASQLKDHTMARTYEAIVCGSFREDSGTVDAPIGRHPSDRNAELLWHCGPFAHSLHRKDEPCYCKNMREWFQVQEGHYTVARIDQDHGKYSVVVGECDSAEGPYTFGTYLWAKFNNLPLWERKLVEGPYIHHVSEIEGSLTKVLVETMKYFPDVKVEVVE